MRKFHGNKVDYPKLLSFGCIALLILFGTYHTVFTIAAFLLCCVFLVIKKNDFCVEMLFFILSMAPIFKLSGSSSSVFTYVVLLYCLLGLARKRFMLNKVEVFVVLFSMYIIATSLISGVVDPKRIIKISANMLLISRLSEVDSSKTYRKIFLAYIIGLLFSSCMRFMDSSIFHINEYSEPVIMQEPTYSVVRFAGLYNDPNYYAVNLLLALVLLVFLYYQGDVSSVVVAGLAVPFVYFAGITGSKSALLMLAFPIGLFAWTCIKKRKYFLVLIGAFIVIVGVAMVLNGRITAFNTTLDRITRSDKTLVGMTSNRSTLWENYLSFLTNNIGKLIIGNSVGIYYLDGLATHNTYLDLPYQLGILGTILFGYIMHSAYVTIVQPHKKNLLNYAGILCILIMYFFLSQLQEFDLPFQIVLCLTCMNIETKPTRVPKGEVCV